MGFGRELVFGGNAKFKTILVLYRMQSFDHHETFLWNVKIDSWILLLLPTSRLDETIYKIIEIYFKSKIINRPIGTFRG